MGLYAFGFHKFYSIIIRYIWLITAIDIQTLYNFSHKLSHSFTIFHNSFQHIQNSFQHIHNSFLSLTISLVLIYSLTFHAVGTFSQRKSVNVWRTLCTSSSLGWPQINPKTSLAYVHSVLFTKMLKVPVFFNLTFLFPVIQMFQFTYIFFDHNIIDMRI